MDVLNKPGWKEAELQRLLTSPFHVYDENQNSWRGDQTAGELSIPDVLSWLALGSGDSTFCSASFSFLL